ncbi:uncharacterized protein LOC144869707 [Branchiostoma floridae x Branchiostoma japonicum]
MGRKLQDLLIFLLIILREFHMPEASCSCSSSTSCRCDELGLTSIPQNLQPTITSLYLLRNEITSLSQSDFSRYRNLQTLDLDTNHISTISIDHQAFYYLTSLTLLDLRSNQLASLRADMFVKLGNLQKLHLLNNEISSIEAGTFSHTPQLNYLSLSGNNLTSIPAPSVFYGLNQLQNLYLSSNHIRHIPSGAFSNLSQLQQLYLYSNQITHILSGAFSNLQQLLQLRLQSNQLTSIPTVQYQFPELTHLYLSNNNITEIPANAFSNQPKLSTLHLFSNRISTVSSTAFTGLANLNKLYLYDNQLTELPDYLFFGLSSLSNLRLQNNAILKIFPNSFTGISILTHLYLSGNNMKTFPIEALSKISSITQLYLQNNQMTTLPLSAYKKLSSILTVNISNNPWQCDCRMVGFRQKLNGSQSFEIQITCTDSQNHGQLLKDINPEDLTCEEPTIVRFEKSDDNSVVEGGTLHLVCEASGIPIPDITVILPSGLNVTVESGGRVTVDVNGTITVTDVTAADAGLYICVAASPVGSVFETLSVGVHLKAESIGNHGSAPSFSLPVLLSSVIGAVAGTVLIGGIILMICFKRKTQNPPSGPDTSVAFNTTNTKVTVTGGHDPTGQQQSENVENLDLCDYEEVNPPTNGTTSMAPGSRHSANQKAPKPPKRNESLNDEFFGSSDATASYANEPAAAALDNFYYYQPLTFKK